jgi:hypothetical protein
VGSSHPASAVEVHHSGSLGNRRAAERRSRRALSAKIR